MGAFCGKPEDDNKTPEEKKKFENEKRNDELLNHELKKDQMKNESELKLLLLGAGESGKSTVFKQIIHLYGGGFSDDTLMSYKKVINNNIIYWIKTLVTQSDILAGELGCKVGANAEPSKQFIAELKNDEEVNDQIAKHIKILWADKGIQITHDNRNRFQLSDSCAYFFEQIDNIARADYKPVYADILRCRARTSGIVESMFRFPGTSNIKVFDVGGQRNQRKKWIHCFENVNALVFVAALSEYDQVLFEARDTNRVVEALNLFEEICNLDWFKNTSIILFLNKRDLFQEKINKSPINKYFADFDGGADYEKACEFFKNKFLQRNKNPQKIILTHVTCATDTTNIKFTLDALSSILIDQNLKRMDLVG